MMFAGTLTDEEGIMSEREMLGFLITSPFQE